MFKRIKATNFLSWAELDFEIKDGVTLIEGYNHDDQTSEGSGKSAIVNALCWGLYGKLPKDAKIDDVIREGESSCVVEIELVSGHTIVRKRKPNKLFVSYLDGGPIVGTDAKETQRIIDEMLGMSFDTFVQSVYFAQNYPKKFITSNEEDRAKILSEILDLKVFDKAREVTKNIAKQLDGETSIIHEQLRGEAGKIVLLQDKVKEYEELKKQRVARLEQSLYILQSKAEDLTITGTKAALVDVGNLLNKLQGAVEVALEQKIELQVELANVDEINKIKRILKAELYEKQLKIDGLTNSLEDDICPECETKFPVDGKQKIKIRESIKTIKQAILPLEDKIKEAKVIVKRDVENKCDELKQEIRLLRNEEVQVKNNFRRANLAAMEAINLEDRIQQAIQELVQEKNDSSLSKMIDETIVQIEQLAKDTLVLQEVLVEKSQESSRASKLRQGFREVKSYVFQGILAELTNKVNNYLVELFEAPVQAHIQNFSDDGNIAKIQVDVTIGNIRRPLGLYSGGQFRRIQLAVDLALSDIISSRSKSPISLKILDEYMKDLSESSMEKILHLLEQRKGSTILIEHNSIFKSIVNNVFSVELRDGVSKSV